MTDLQRAKLAIVAEIEHLDPELQKRLSKKIARMCAVAVKDDRALRVPGPDPTGGLAKLFDVFFNGRPA